ncbi:vanin-like protein 2 isoform X1 [Musca domestica]|uniref:Vanin-like protein 2 isoform X1 n=1 Tax=Musca domestica TaxID=7370 RepID=A0A9J7I0J6_MUSDO|nr:vanin-like protein 2 isoform X1 [Musca domestica]
MLVSKVFAPSMNKSLSLWRMLRLALLLLLSQIVNKSKAQYVNASNFYTAGVVEFRPTIAGMSSADLVADHLRAYLEIITSNEAADVDILVFPEGTLNNALQLTYVPSEKQEIIPCSHPNATEYAEFLVALSCAAAQVRKYLVINLSEKEDCPATPADTRPCATNGLNVYNTNVVFDREGRIISRYRKVNIYVENKNTTLQPEYGMFDTDFGVRFGHFICFDMLFYTPAQELVHRYGISDLIFTSLFYSELPFLAATQLQQGWAWGNNVNLLAAGASNPRAGSTGTGIFSGRKRALASVMITSGEGERKLYKARVPKKGTLDFDYEIDYENSTRGEEKLNSSTGRHLDGMRLLKDPQIVNFNSMLLPLGQRIFEKICHEDFCCEFSLESELVEAHNNTPTYKYRMGVFSGSRSYEKDQRNNIKVCGIYSCRNDQPESCGELWESEEFNSEVYLTNILIKGKFPKAPELLIMPSSLDANLNPVMGGEAYWKYEPQNKHIDVDVWLHGRRRDIMTFGLYANYYNSGVGAMVLNKMLAIFLGVIFIFMVKQ